MSTRAHIEFTDEFGDKFHIDRSHDGFPDVVLPDIEEAVNSCEGRWSGSEIGQLVSYFLGKNFDPKRRIQKYEPCSGRAGDESYFYYCNYSRKDKKYNFGVVHALGIEQEGE